MEQEAGEGEPAKEEEVREEKEEEAQAEKEEEGEAEVPNPFLENMESMEG